MKRLLALVLAAVLVVASLVGCTGGSGASGTLIVGSWLMSGNFINGFGDSAYDDWVKTILHGYYSTYLVTDFGEIVLNNTVVKNQDVTTNDGGNKTYTFELHNDLKWNNGEPITAKDFVFSLLWYASLDWAAAGGTSAIGHGLLGYSDYHEGTAQRFAGVQLIDVYKFSMTIDAAVPYFYETSYVSVYPIYMAGWSPSSKIDSTAEGSKLISNNPDWTLAFDTKRISQTERYAPTVTSGPYTFVSFENNAVTMKVNPEFKGDRNGKKPQLEYIIIQDINPTTDIDQWIDGEVDAVSGVIEGAKIEMAEKAPETATSYYPRNGFGGLFFHCDFGPTQYKEVRQALAYLIDRQLLISQVLDGHGSVTNAFYSLGQWMYIENQAAIDALPNFVLDTAKANELLDASPYKFEADGTTRFNPGKASAEGGYFRHNDKGERLILNHLETEDGNVDSPVTEQMLANTPQAGIDWRVTRSDFGTLIDQYYEGHLKGDERKYHSFHLATSFSVDFDPYYSYHSDWLYVSYYNSQHISDPELDESMVKMRQLNPDQKAEFSAEWVKFQTKWSELLPVVPLYSTHYYDVYRKEVRGFKSTPFATWADNVCEISKTE